jgi:hypothetical protein
MQEHWTALWQKASPEDRLVIEQAVNDLLELSAKTSMHFMQLPT